MMITEIGLVAGEIWQYLDKYREVNLTRLLEALKKDRDLVLMSLGWLGREGHILLQQQGQDIKITLRRPEG
ncbi:MAG TPA: winged helix-turn-helix domain-containing protein [bacterium]|nr:winged helix-turn-helix domain-containing protein [bacterium]HOL67585.1 winged helix-turn-helix domain-containing protein [bacterium]HPP13128.1 winged helix-turn-helix domain-containing protein [bacterium]